MATPERPDPGQPSVAGYESIAGWDPATLQAVERELARSIGPVARVLVKRAARAHASLDQLAREIAPSIPDEAARQAFLGRYDGRGAVAAQPDPHDLANAPTNLGDDGPGVTPADIEAVTRLLTLEMGPIARVVVKRAAVLCTTRQALCLQVAGAIEDPSARARFLKAAASGVSSRSP